MNRKEVKTLEEVENIITPLATGEYVIDVKPLPDNSGYAIEWELHKTYVAFADGKEYLDEVWRTEDGRVLQIQDIEPEHCRNILRMIIRQNRELLDKIDNIFESVITGDDQLDGPTIEIESANTKKYLH